MAEVAQEQQYENPMEGQQEYGDEQATEEEAMEVRKNRGRRFLQNRRCVEMLLGYTDDSNGILKISSDALFSLSPSPFRIAAVVSMTDCRMPPIIRYVTGARNCCQ